jgi:dTDP-4-dehydrorhamnose reductase
MVKDINILILGAGGMKGHIITRHFIESGYNVTSVALTKKMPNIKVLDVTDKSAFERFLIKSKFDVVINCIGVLIKKSEERKDLAAYLNSFLPHQLEYFYKESLTRIIHLSTDCVFSGDSSPYYEDSIADGKLYYDRSKYLGEIVNDKDLTIRTSVVGPELSAEGTGLFNWFMMQKGQIFGYTNAKWTGVSSLVLARAINRAIECKLNGIYHLTPINNISKYDLLCLFKKIFHKDILHIIPDEREMPDRTLKSRRTDFDFIVPDYTEMFEEMKSYIENNKVLYSHYYN